MKANFNSPLVLSSNRKRVKVRGPLLWEDDGIRRIRVKDVEITQGNVVARGDSGDFKRGDGDQWWCDADTSNDQTFAPGVATAVATIERLEPDPSADVFDWTQVLFVQ
jgi:hypothetical protein